MRQFDLSIDQRILGSVLMDKCNAWKQEYKDLFYRATNIIS